MAGEPRGCIPSTTTPFDANRELDEGAARTQAGGHGVAARGSAGAGEELDGDERRRLAGIVADERRARCR
jgi:dihydrodipicolinate synthase/N-acetylneuraminate lyase